MITKLKLKEKTSWRHVTRKYTDEHRLFVGSHSHPCPSLHDVVSWKLLVGILSCVRCCLFIAHIRVKLALVSLISINACHWLLCEGAKTWKYPLWENPFWNTMPQEKAKWNEGDYYHWNNDGDADETIKLDFSLYPSRYSFLTFLLTVLAFITSIPCSCYIWWSFVHFM